MSSSKKVKEELTPPKEVGRLPPNRFLVIAPNLLEYEDCNHDPIGSKFHIRPPKSTTWEEAEAEFLQLLGESPLLNDPDYLGITIVSAHDAYTNYHAQKKAAEEESKQASEAKKPAKVKSKRARTLGPLAALVGELWDKSVQPPVWRIQTLKQARALAEVLNGDIDERLDLLPMVFGWNTEDPDARMTLCNIFSRSYVQSTEEVEAEDDKEEDEWEGNDVSQEGDDEEVSVPDIEAEN